MKSVQNKIQDRTIAMPANEIVIDIFGGWLMAWIWRRETWLHELLAEGQQQSPWKTLNFPIILYADLESIGRTSMKIHVVAWRRAKW